MYKNGVYEGDELALVTEMREVVGIHQSLLKSPTFVLSDVATKKVQRLVARVNNGEFNFVSVMTPLPTAKHSIYFDVLCGLFASNWNDKGILNFTFSGVLRDAGKSPNSRSRIVVAETIRRYMGCHANWECFYAQDKGDSNWAGSLIVESSIFDSEGRLKTRRARNVSKEDQHWIRLHHKIVEALDPRLEPKTRLFQSEVFKLGLTQSEQIVYRYFHGHWDTKEIWKSIYKKHEGLIDIFKWISPQHKFLPWLIKALEGLKKRKLIESYRLNENKSAVCVKCANINENKQKITLVSDSDPYAPEKLKRVGATRNISSLSNEAIIEEYLTRKAANKVPSDMTVPIDMMLARPATIKAAVDLIKGHVLSEQGA